MWEPTVVALSGKKGSGKNTLSSFVVQYYYDHARDLDPHAAGWQSSACELAFADGIKDFCINILGLEYDQCHGSDEEKNTPTQYKWEDTPNYRSCLPLALSEYMTGRDVMQIFGTECVRTWFGNVWAEATVRKIRKMPIGLAVITDNRFPNEVETILGQPKGYIIRLTRSPFDGSDSHVSETALDDFDWERPKCFVIDNAHMTMDEQNVASISILQKIFQQGAGK